MLTKNKIDILIGIPSYNEEDSISNVVQKIDLGLVKYFPKFKSLITNIDSNSEDNTKTTFLKTRTKTQKCFISGGKSPRGKGVNIIKLFQLAKRLNTKYICIFDADLITISEKWLKLLLEPLIKKTADFVIPFYTRNRYEGNTTNHFCYPLIAVWFKQAVRQPIAGDFGMNKKFIDYLLKQKIPNSAKLYGIDIFLTTHTIGGGFKIREVFLGRKIHKPSFDKIVPMFQQVAASTLYTINKYKNNYQYFNKVKKEILLKNQKWVDEFIGRPNEEKISNIQKYALHKLSKLPERRVWEYMNIPKGEIRGILKRKLKVNTQLWVKVLKSIISYVSSHTISEKRAEQISRIILPFFLLRVVCYFEEIDKGIPDIAEKIIQNQVIQLNKTSKPYKLDKNLKKGYPNYRILAIENKIKGGRIMNVWEKRFYSKEGVFRKKIFRIPHQDLFKFVKLLREIKAKRILDLGCGTGRHIIALAKKGFQIYGLDVSPTALKETKERLRQEGLKAKLELENIYKKLPYRDNFFDGVISIKVLHHGRILRIKKLVEEIERVMCPGGILMVEVPKKEKDYTRKKSREIEPGTYISLKGPEKGVSHHIFASKKELKTFFANFEVLDIHCTGKDKIQTPSPHYTMFAKLRKTSKGRRKK